MTEQLNEKALQKVDAQVLPITDQANELVISSQADLELGIELVQSGKNLVDEVEETFKPHVQAADKAHKSLLATMRKFTDPLKKAEATIKEKIAEFCKDNPDAEAKGLSLRENKGYTVSDPMEVIKAVAKGKLPPKLLVIDQKVLKELASAGLDIPTCTEDDLAPTVTIRKAAS